MTSIDRDFNSKVTTDIKEDLAVVGAVLQNLGQFFDEIRNEVDLLPKIFMLLISSITFLGSLSKRKGEASRGIVCLHQDLRSDLPRPYTTLKFEEGAFWLFMGQYRVTCSRL